MKVRRMLLLFLVLALLACGIAYWKLTSPAIHDSGSANATPLTPSVVEPKPETEEEKTRRMLLGVWQDEYQGKRTMTLHKDGNGTMVVELSGVQAFLFASKLRFDMKWSLNGKTLMKKTVGGEPADKVNLILNTMGNTAEDTLLEITDDRLLLLDKNGATKYGWKRPPKDAPKKK